MITDKYVIYLVILKTLFASATLYYFAVYLGFDMFTYPDFYTSYGNCTEKPYTNILYSKLFCDLSSVTGKIITHRSPFFIFLAALINMLILVAYFKIFERYLNKQGKYLLIILFVIHPYINIYFFRFYTEIFASLGIFLILFYKIRNLNINFFFVITAIILINFRNALIPVFVLYGLYEIYSQINKKNSKVILYSIILIIASLLTYLSVMEFSSKFISINSNVNFFEKIAYNIILAFGFRESIGVSRDIFVLDDWFDILSFVTSMLLLIIHFVGLYGVTKFSLKEDKSILVIFIYLAVPILAVSHMRYLVPLIPVLLFGFSYILFKNQTEQI